MDAKIPASLMIVGTLACPARSEIFHATLSVSWTEVVAGTNILVTSPNGTIEPGEGALISISIAFTPVGTQVSYNYPTGGIAAPVAGFRAVTFDVIPTQTQGGSWSNPTTTSGFTGGFGIQFPGEEQLNFCSIFQPQPPLGSYPISTNPLLAVWRQV